MGNEAKEALLAELGGRASGEEGLKDLLVNTLADESVVVEDSLDIKRKRGRPPKSKEEQGWGYGYSRKAAIEAEKERLRKLDRLNPQPTEELQNEQALRVILRELSLDLSDMPDKAQTTERMIEELDELRKESGVKKLNSTNPLYAIHRGYWKKYQELKEKKDELFKLAEYHLEKKKYDEVEDIIERIKEMPQQLQEAYKKILTSYDDLCDSLCSIMDGKRSEKEKEKDGEEQGIGMISGEDFKSYRKRMSAIGRKKEIPKTIEKIDIIVEQTERRWRSVAGVSIDEFIKIKENFRKTFWTILEKSSLASNMTVFEIDGMLRGGLAAQGGYSKKGNKTPQNLQAILGETTERPRYVFSRKCFGVDKGLKADKYEKYGCLHPKSDYGLDNLIGSQYGRNVVRWKPEQTIATMTLMDSLWLSRNGLNYITPCLVTNPSPVCFNPENQRMVEALRQGALNIGLATLCGIAGTPYVELQLHGDFYGAEAVESITFWDEDEAANLSAEAIGIIIENEIPVYLNGEEVEIGEDGSIQRKEEGNA